MLRDQDRLDFASPPKGTRDELLISADGRAKLDTFLAKAKPEEWSTPRPMGFRDVKASKAKMLMQALWHSINHHGQRQQGFK